MMISEGVIATPQTLSDRHVEHLPDRVIAEIRDSGLRGIFVLCPAEIEALSVSAGGLTAKERTHLRAVINTRDVYPYGVVLPDSPDVLIWLPASHGGRGGEFPEDMPTLEYHLKRFRPLLDATVEGYGKKLRRPMYRPWWSAHNPRIHLVEGRSPTGSWADVAVTTRWGDRKLVTGLAPAGALPLSGLHALTGAADTSAAYLVGLINSTPVQELAEALAPGSVSQEDFEHLGLPQFSGSIAEPGLPGCALRDVPGGTGTAAAARHLPGGRL